MRAKLVLYPTLQLLARLRQPRLVARLLLFTSVRLDGRPVGQNTSARYRVLALNLNKPGSREDIEESLSYDPDVEVVSWPVYALKALASVLLAPQLNNKRYDVDDPNIRATKLEYRRFLLDVWRHLVSISRIDAVVTANFGYFAQREFGAALREFGTPFIVLHKENVKSPGRVKYWEDIYRTRGSFEGTRILVYNDTERDLQIRTKVATADQIVVTGMPRLDRVHRLRRERPGPETADGSPQLLFLSFWRKEKLTATENVPDTRRRVDASEGEWAERSWTELCEGTHRAIIALARQNPHARVVMKTKSFSRRVQDVLNILQDEQLPPNLTMVSGGDPIPLITQSAVVVGFNTTTLLEALAAGKPVIVPHFAEAKDPRMQALLIDVGPSAKRAGSPKELVELAEAYLNAPQRASADLDPEACEALRFWVGNEDGRAGQRVLEAVRSEIDRSRQAPH